ncbi:MAG TPA: hypothetical protein VMA30_09325 [Xanthobacteraceae bacterium]|nr:hypothetical protein [Xanthobacteraceae bacterium]
MLTKTRTISRLRETAARYHQARKSLHTPASRQSRYGLDWMNFFLADMQTGFGRTGGFMQSPPSRALRPH